MFDCRRCVLLFLFLDIMQIKLADPAHAHTHTHTHTLFQQICHQRLPRGSDVKTREMRCDVLFIKSTNPVRITALGRKPHQSSFV